jgi:hypothetical protein
MVACMGVCLFVGFLKTRGLRTPAPFTTPLFVFCVCVCVSSCLMCDKFGGGSREGRQLGRSYDDCFLVDGAEIHLAG